MSLPFPQEVEHPGYLVLRGLLVDADVADAGQQREVDDARLVLLVVRHEGVELVVLLAVEREDSVVLADEGYGLPQLVLREAALHGALV